MEYNSWEWNGRQHCAAIWMERWTCVTQTMCTILRGTQSRPGDIGNKLKWFTLANWAKWPFPVCSGHKGLWHSCRLFILAHQAKTTQELVKFLQDWMISLTILAILLGIFCNHCLAFSPQLEPRYLSTFVLLFPGHFHLLFPSHYSKTPKTSSCKSPDFSNSLHHYGFLLSFLFCLGSSVLIVSILLCDCWAYISLHFIFIPTFFAFYPQFLCIVFLSPQ